MLKRILLLATLALPANFAIAQVTDHPKMENQSGDPSIKLTRVENAANETIFYLAYPKESAGPGKDIFVMENKRTIPVARIEKTAYQNADSLQEKLHFPKLRKTTGRVDLFEDKNNGFYFKGVKTLDFNYILAHPLSLADVNGPVNADYFGEMYDLLYDKVKKSVLWPLEGVYYLDSADAPDFYTYNMEGATGKARDMIVVIKDEKTGLYDAYRRDGIQLNLRFEIADDGFFMSDVEKNSRQKLRLMSDTVYTVSNVDETPYAQPGKTANASATIVFDKIGFNQRYVNQIKAELKARERTASGFFVSADGYIATAYSYVRGGADITIQSAVDAKVYKAEVAFTDKDNGLAVLKITDPAFKPIKALPYEVNFAGTDLGAEVFTVGYTRDAETIEDVELTKGYINSKSGPDHDIKQYQVSTAFTVGGGAPLFDKDGNVIGVTLENGLAPASAGFAIKARYLQDLMGALPGKSVLHNTIKTLSQTDKIKQLAEYTVLIKVK